ncbi:hypothetical protein, partial [Endozoicomonas elysicola]
DGADQRGRYHTEAAFVVKRSFFRRRKKLSNSLTLPLRPCQRRRILPRQLDLSTDCFSFYSNNHLQITLPVSDE